jgi:RNA polymerase sigma-70 factor, ECF subfamily
MTQADAGGLIARLIEGDAAALEQAYRDHGGHCRAVAWRVLHDDALAQDAVQEAFLSLWRHREGLVVRTAGILPWLVVVTRNAALNMLRSTTRLAEREAAAPRSEPTDPLTRIDALDEARDVHDAIAQLPEEQRAVITMAYFQHRTFAQIAAATNAPTGTVKRRAQLALARLAKNLGARKS